MKEWLSKQSLAKRMAIMIFASVFILTSIIFIYVYQYSRGTISEHLKENSKLLTHSTVNEVERILAAVQKIPDNFSKLIEDNNYTDAELEKLLKIAIENNKEIYGAVISFDPEYIGNDASRSTIYVSRDSQQETVNTESVSNVDHNDQTMDWYLIPKLLGRSLWSEPYFDDRGKNIVMSTYSVPLYKTINGKKQFIGVLAADLSLNWLQDIVSSIKIYKTGYAFMISRNGSLVTHPMKELIMNETVFSIAEETHSPQLREIGRSMMKGESSFAEVEYHNVSTGSLSWISYAPVSINGWSLGIVYPVHELLASQNRLFETILLLAIIGGVVLFGIISFISKSIANPIKELAIATQKIGEGNFDVELPKYNNKDEIGDLTNTFAVMQDELKQTIDKLKNANDELELYSHTLEEKVESRTLELRTKNSLLDKALNNVKTLSKIGRNITSTLNLESIFSTVYETVNNLLDTDSFSLMVLNEKEQLLECKLAIERGERLPEFSFSTSDKNRFGVWCVDNRKPVFINDVDTEYINYISSRSKPKAGEYVSSLIYLPLIVGERVIGVISAQSFKKNAYTENHLDILSNLANYTAIALDNAYAYESINKANTELKEAQAQLIQSEKMASLGQLTAGIAHEIKNPLNFINNFSELSVELSNELLMEIESQADKIDSKSMEYMKELLTDLDHNVQKINEHGRRADSIVKGMLLHSRGKSGEKQKTNLNDLLNEYLNLAYHGFRAQDSSFNCKLESNYDSTLEPVEVVPQNLSRVFLNILNNGCYSVSEKKRERKDSYSPCLSVSTKNLGDKVEIRIRDNGKGIPQDILDKIFNPFFTTKPAGKGTGLGLSLSYDIIVQEHKGELKIETEAGEFAEFIITIPKNL